MESLSDVSAKWMMQCIANPSYLITKNENRIVLYDSRNHKVVAFKELEELCFVSKGGMQNENQIRT